MRTEVIGDATLHLWDCLQLIPALPKVDAVVTSPPYNLIKEWTGGGPGSNLKSLEARYEDWYADEVPEAEYQEQQKLLISMLLANCNGSVFYNHKIRYALRRRNEIYHPLDWLRNFPIWCEIIWDRGGGLGGNSSRYIISDERIYQLGRPKTWNTGNGFTTVWRIPPAISDGHVCAFPVEIPLRCIGPSTDPGDTVLDPYMGSGTTGVACAKLGRKFIGIEIEEPYFDMACERISAAYAQGKLFA